MRRAAKAPAPAPVNPSNVRVIVPDDAPLEGAAFPSDTHQWTLTADGYAAVFPGTFEERWAQAVARTEGAGDEGAFQPWGLLVLASWTLALSSGVWLFASVAGLVIGHGTVSA